MPTVGRGPLCQTHFTRAARLPGNFVVGIDPRHKKQVAERVSE